jgi:hypothetical protein
MRFQIKIILKNNSRHIFKHSHNVLKNNKINLQ